MKQGILISGYKNLKHIKQIIDFFNEDFSFYIHIDKKSKLPESEIKEISLNNKVAFFSRKYVTNWGGRNTLKSILLLTIEALRNPEIEYIHLISGGDFPARGSAYFTTYLNSNKGKEFLENFPMPTDKWEQGGMNRLHYYNLYDVFNAKTHRGWRAVQYALKIQKKTKFQRKISPQLPALHGGSTWWTLSRNCLQYVMDFTLENPMLLNRLKHSFCSEEIYFQTIIMNSPFSDKVINNNLRYIKWEYKNGSMPAILDEEDYEEVEKSNQLFARKIEYPVSMKLVTGLMKNK
jgi:hypothetical protein